MKNMLFNIKFVFKILLQSSKGYIILALLYSFLSVLDPLYNIIPSKVVLDNITKNRPLYDTVIFLIVLFLIGAFTNIYAQWYKYKFLPINNLKVQKLVKDVFLNKCIKTEAIKFFDPVFYDKYSIALNQTENGIINFCNIFFGAITNILSIIVVGSIVLTINSFLIILVILNVIISVLINFKKGKIQYSYDMEIIPQNRKNHYIGRLFFSREVIEDLKIFNVGNLLHNMQNNAFTSIKNSITKFFIPKMTLDFLFTVLSLLIRFSIFVCLAKEIMEGKNTVGDFAALLSATVTLSTLLSSIFNIFPNLYRQSLYINDLREFINDDSCVEEKQLITDFQFHNKIQVKSLSFYYPNSNKLILKNINFSIKKGMKIAIVGDNGAGKSTLLKLIMRLYLPSSGNITIDTIDYININADVLREKYGAIFQDGRYYAFTIAENILQKKVKTNIDEEKVWEAIENSGLSEMVRKLPKGIHTCLTNEFNKDGINLSGGERQKLAFARAYASNKEILLLDEPTSAMDPVSEHDFFTRLLNIAKDKTVIFISHRLSITNIADYIIVLDKGEIIEEGTHKELMNNQGKYYNNYKLQMSKYKIDDSI